MLEPIEIAILVVASFVSSAWTAVIGMGGGIFLISIMPGLLPAEAIIPIHGIIQFTSNITRAAFGLRDVVWKLIWPFAAGALLGALIGYPVLGQFPTEILPLLLGIFIIFLVWAPWVLKNLKLPGGFFTLGTIETFMTLFVGVAGPLTGPFLIKEKLAKDQIVVTSAVISLIAHGLKIVTFGILGFVFAPYLLLILGMIVSVTLGSWVGTRIRHYVSEEFFLKLFKIVVTLLAGRMILSGLGIL